MRVLAPGKLVVTGAYAVLEGAPAIVVAVDRIFYQCAKAIVRSKLWDPATQVDRKSLPSNGTILAAIRIRSS